MRAWLTPEQSQWSWQRLAVLVAGLAALVSAAPGWLAGAVFTGACRRVRLAEALARRLLICRVAALGVTPVSGVRAAPRPASQGPQPLAVRAPCRARLALVDRLDLGRGERPERAPGLAEASAGDRVSTAHLARRLAGLSALIAAPERYALLMARRLSAPLRAGRASLLRPGRPPGLPEDAYDLDGSALQLAHAGALAVLNAPP